MISNTITIKKCKCDRLWCDKIKNGEMTCELCFYDIYDTESEKKYFENKKNLLTHTTPKNAVTWRFKRNKNEVVQTFFRKSKN